MISLDDAKRHLRIDFEDDDVDIALKLTLARAIVGDYIGGTIYQDVLIEDYATEAEFDAAYQKATLRNNVVDAAILLVLGEIYANREAQADPLSPTVKAILERLRMPSYA